MPLTRLKEFLDQNHVPYVIITHSPAYTAQGIAASAHVKGKELAKTVIVRLDGRLAMAVLPAPYRVDLDKLREVTGCRKVELATEKDFESVFPGCEVGAMPPFGNLFGLPVFVARRLTEDEEIAFNAGTHRELIRMSYRDFERLVQPTVVSFATP
ncbi:MAG: YbaK/EbsC family protein [Acidobacteriota bacterium]